MNRAFAASVFCLALLTTGPALAAPTAADKATARALGTEGIELFQAHSYPAALDKLVRAKALVATPVLDLYIARCQVELGHLVEGSETYRALLRTPADAAAQPAAKKAVADAKDELATLEPRIPAVKIVVQPAGAEGLEVAIDGQAVPSVIVGIDRAIDPGRHAIRVARAGFTPAETSVELKAGEKKTVSLTLGVATGAVAPNAVEGLGVVGLAPSGKASGPSGSAEIAVGYSVLPGLAVGGALAVEQVASPKVTIAGNDVTTVSVGTFAMLGPCIEWYPSATGGFHAGAVLGGARLTIKDSSAVVADHQPVGGGGALGAGYEWWIGDEWSLGGAVRFLGATLSDQGIRHTVAAGSLLATLTYQ